MTLDKKRMGKKRAANELRKQGILVFGGGVFSIWLIHSFERFKKRLAAIEAKSAKRV